MSNIALYTMLESKNGDRTFQVTGITYGSHLTLRYELSEHLADNVRKVLPDEVEHADMLTMLKQGVLVDIGTRWPQPVDRNKIEEPVAHQEPAQENTEEKLVSLIIESL